MALMDSELIYGQIPWAIVTFLQAGFKGSQRLIHDMLFVFSVWHSNVQRAWPKWQKWMYDT